MHPYIKFRTDNIADQPDGYGHRPAPPPAHPHPPHPTPTPTPTPPPPPKPTATSWTIPALCAAYGWPATPLIGGGVIAIVELGGGWTQADVAQAFSAMGQPVPAITDVSVDGTTNSPGSDADAEVALDIQVAGGAYFAATGKPAVIRVYWSQDITAAVIAATRDGCDVCSISWGEPESQWGTAAIDAMEAAATAATAAGMVVFAAAGDNDSSDGEANNPAEIDGPACCPHVVSCGGTHLPIGNSGSQDETVWNDNPGNTDGEGTGGGYSRIFPVQSWQIGAPAGASAGDGRMIPDVAANADPQTGYDIVLNGRIEVVGGTSAVAPLYAGLFAAFGRKLGFVSPELWLHPAAFNDITQGNNGFYSASVGPDPCSGLGSPKAGAIAAIV